MSKKKYIRSWNDYSFFRKLWYRILYAISKRRLPKSARKYLDHQYAYIKYKIMRIFGIAKEKTMPIIDRAVKNENFSDAINVNKYGAVNAVKNIVGIGLKSISEERVYRDSINNAVDIIGSSENDEDKKKRIIELSKEISSNDLMKSEDDVKIDIIAAAATKNSMHGVHSKKKRHKNHNKKCNSTSDGNGAIKIKLNFTPGNNITSVGDDATNNIIDRVKSVCDTLTGYDCGCLQDSILKVIYNSNKRLEVSDGCVVMHRIKPKDIAIAG